MRKKKVLVITSVVLLALSFVAGGLYLTYADIEEGEESGLPFSKFMGDWRMRGRFFNCLEEEQAQELREMVEGMKADDADPVDIKAAVQEYLEDHDIECDRPELSETQIQGLEQLRAEIQELVKQRISELDIEFPEMDHGFGLRFRSGVRGHTGMGHGFGYRGEFRDHMGR